MSVLLIAGSPSERSRSAVLLDLVGQRLILRGATVERLHVRDLSPQALLLADTAHRTVAAAIDKAVAILFSEGLRMPATAGFEPVPFSRVRCSA